MLIGAIASSTSNGPGLNPLAAAKTQTQTSSAAAAPKATTPAATSTSASSTASTTSAASSTHGHSGGGSGGQSSSAAAISQLTSYSTTVGGTQYSGSVQESDGEYVATVSNLPGASASGTSVLAAENNLDNVIDMLV